MERYYWFKSVSGPKDQNGLALKVTQDGNLIDLTDMLKFERRGNKTYIADTNVNVWGKSRGKQDPIKLSVEENLTLRIRQQPSSQIYLTEISEQEAKRVVGRTEILRNQQNPKVISLTPNSPNLRSYF